MTINTNIYPKDGYWFQDKDGARIFGQSWVSVFARVAAYRKRTHQPEGNVAEEVTVQACSRNPGLCNNGVSVSPTDQSLPLKTRVLAWLNGVRERASKGDPPHWVDEGTAKTRIIICAACPLNKEIGSGCASCRAAVRELRNSILGGRYQDGRLQGCENIGEDTCVSVHIEQTTLDRPALPVNCWRKRTL